MKVAVTTLAFCVAALLALGLVMLYSSMMIDASAGAHDLMMQMVWCALGLILCVTATALDYQLLKKLAWPVLWVRAGSAGAGVCPAFGHHAQHGAHRWIGSRQLHASSRPNLPRSR